jgi:hypothetical protein
VDWDFNSLGMKEKDSLDDKYGIIAAYSDRFFEGDVTDKKVRKDIILRTNRKYELVTGDIGMGIKDYTVEHLQELLCKSMQWGQFALAVGLCKEHGNIVLKMYSLITYHSVYIIDTMTNLFEKVEIIKPYTSKIFNYECYLLGINRNSTKFEDNEIENEMIITKSPNFEIIEKYETKRIKEKMNLAKLYEKINKSKDWEKEPKYKKYLQESKRIFDKINKFIKNTK